MSAVSRPGCGVRAAWPGTAAGRVNGRTEPGIATSVVLPCSPESATNRCVRSGRWGADRLYSCGHRFHTACIVRADTDRCPLCRAFIFVREPSREGWFDAAPTELAESAVLFAWMSRLTEERVDTFIIHAQMPGHVQDQLRECRDAGNWGGVESAFRSATAVGKELQRRGRAEPVGVGELQAFAFAPEDMDRVVGHLMLPAICTQPC